MSRDDTRAWQAQSLLLDYPDERLVGRLDLLRRVARELDDPVGAPLLRFVDHLAGTPAVALAADYVATFDNRRRCRPYLTYYAHGDTRKRGMALLRLKQAYAAVGLRLVDDELPDHLAVMLEFAAVKPDAGRALLVEYRAGLELLRLALRESRSPWADVLDSVSATLPPLRGDERQAIARLVAQGPPAEQVGLAPFAPPEYMPQPATLAEPAPASVHQPQGGRR
jgi:nitrate reductase molybdenum cofactor assembly chaperone NarJ/NarW